MAGATRARAVRYTQRQRRAFENIRFVLDEALAGRTVPATDADRVYADAVARPIRDAQALVAGRQTAVILRLLGYLTPYRAQVTLGMIAAAIITLVSLVPPYLAGYLIDRVVRPVQDGTDARASAAALVAWIAVAAMALVYVLRQVAAHRAAPPHVGPRRVGRARPARRAVRAHPAALRSSFFSRKKTGSLITRVTSDTDRLWEFLAFGVVDVSLVARDADRARRRAALARLAARPRDDAAGAALLLVDLPARRAHEPRSSSARGASGRA